MIKISIIIPIYNNEKYIRECLDSVLSQTLREIEIICVDDGSTDSSYEILLEYGDRYRNIIVIHQENCGSGPARNKGMECAKGKYVCFMDSDDYYAQNCALEHLYDNAEKNNVPVCGGNISKIDGNGRIDKIGKVFDKNKKILAEEYADLYYYTRFIYSLKMIHDNNITFPPYRRFQDPPFLLNVMAHAREFYVIEEDIYICRVGYKKLKFNLDIIVDLLKGIRECFEISKRNNYVKTYNEYLKRMLVRLVEYIYPYASQNNEDVWRLIDDINRISMEWMGEIPDFFANREHMETYISNVRDKRSYMISQCQVADNVVIYGAGKAGQHFLSRYEKACKHIAGFAVSNKGNENFIGGYKIKAVEDYDREALVIVAVSEKYAEDILQNLARLKFKNVCYVKWADLKLIECLEDDKKGDN